MLVLERLASPTKILFGCIWNLIQESFILQLENSDILIASVISNIQKFSSQLLWQKKRYLLIFSIMASHFLAVYFSALCLAFHLFARSSLLLRYSVTCCCQCVQVFIISFLLSILPFIMQLVVMPVNVLQNISPDLGFFFLDPLLFSCTVYAQLFCCSCAAALVSQNPFSILPTAILASAKFAITLSFSAFSR